MGDRKVVRGATKNRKKLLVARVDEWERRVLREEGHISKKRTDSIVGSSEPDTGDGGSSNILEIEKTGAFWDGERKGRKDSRIVQGVGKIS